MAIAITLKDYLENSGTQYDVVPHTYTTSSMLTAEAAHVSGDKLVKSVLLEDENGYVLAVIPATHHLELGRISRQLNRRLGLATEAELENIFTDCDLGAIPPIGNVYGVEVIMDECLKDCNEVYFEAGDHIELVHMESDAFMELMQNANVNHISHHM
jgi:Ala-tRNA(Pro) deacylase